MSAQQNLVPNPSFEIFDTCPQFSNKLLYANPWFDPTKTSSDYFNTCALNPSDVGIPNNLWGYQLAYQGNAYAGFAAFDYGNNMKNYREYVSVPLLKTLTKNKKYCLSFYLNLGDSCTFSVKTIGAVFSKDSLIYPVNLPINLVPSIVSNQLLNDKENWVKISGTYESTGIENFLTIGNFSDDANCGLTLLKDTTFNPYCKAAFYYVDLILLTECFDNPESIPNIFTPNNDGINDTWEFVMSEDANCVIYNRWGIKIFEINKGTIKWNGGTTSGVECTDGIYYYTIQTIEKTFKGFIQLIR